MSARGVHQNHLLRHHLTRLMASFADDAARGKAIRGVLAKHLPPSSDDALVDYLASVVADTDDADMAGTVAPFLESMGAADTAAEAEALTGRIVAGLAELRVGGGAGGGSAKPPSPQVRKLKKAMKISDNAESKAIEGQSAWGLEHVKNKTKANTVVDSIVSVAEKRRTRRKNAKLARKAGARAGRRKRERAARMQEEAAAAAAAEGDAAAIGAGAGGGGGGKGGPRDLQVTNFDMRAGGAGGAASGAGADAGGAEGGGSAQVLLKDADLNLVHGRRPSNDSCAKALSPHSLL